jgi:hypothetical protein
MLMQNPFMRTTVAHLSVLGTACLLAACFIESPLAGPVPAPNTRIVAQVTDTGELAMKSAIGPDATEVEGIVEDADATSWNLRLLRVEYRNGQSVTWNRELIRFPRSALSQATERRFSNKRSWLMAGILTSTAFLAARFLGVIGGGDNTPAPPPPPN